MNLRDAEIKHLSGKDPSQRLEETEQRLTDLEALVATILRAPHREALKVLATYEKAWGQIIL